MKIRLILLILLVAGILPVTARPSNAGENTWDDYMVENWEYKKDFPDISVYRITQTPDGYMWLKALSGIYRFDGKTFDRVPFYNKDKSIYSVTYSLGQDTGGNLLVFGEHNVFIYHKESHRLLLQEKNDGFLQTAVTTSLNDSYGNTWFGTFYSGLYRKKGTQLVHFGKDEGLTCSYVFSLAEDAAGKLWVCGHTEGLFTGINGHFKKIPVPGIGKEYAVYYVLPESNSGTWICTNRGVVRIKTDGTSVLYDETVGLSDNIADTGAFINCERAIIVGTRTGFTRFTPSANGNVEVKPYRGRFRSQHIFEDREGNIWIGTTSSGLKKVRKRMFRVFSLHQGVPLGNNAIFRDSSGNIWSGDPMGGLSRFKNGVFEPYVLKNTTNEHGILSIDEDNNGALYMGTSGHGLKVLKNGRVKQFGKKEGLPSNTVRLVYKNSKGRMWMSDGRYNLFYFCPDKETVVVPDTGNVFNNGYIQSIYEDRNHTLWVGTFRGLKGFKQGDIKSEPMSMANGMQINYIHQETTPPRKGEDGHVLWLCTAAHGLVRLVYPRGKTISFTTDTGLYTNNVSAMTEDRRGYFWIFSDIGVMRVHKCQLEDYAAGTIDKIDCTTFNMADGLPSILAKKYSRNNILNEPDGHIWFSTYKGYAVTQPEKMIINKQPPGISIKSATFNYKPVSLEQPGNTYKGISDIVFKFSALSFTAPHKVMMKYRLLGYTDDWTLVEPFEERTAHYSRLPYGTYTFQVTGCNDSGIWNTTGASFSFELKPYFHQTIIFKIAVILVSILLCLILYRETRRRIYLRRLNRRYRNSTLDPEKAENTLKKLIHLLEVKEVFTDEALNLNGLAAQLNIAPRYLSQIVNERLNKNFRELLNTYRIEKAKKMLANPGKNDPPILKIAFDAGFNSKEGFYKAFKKETGQTPGEYKRSITG
jgi:ligand-binding sensor domain-containing protein/AraC-like DNA-binding protein